MTLLKTLIFTQIGSVGARDVPFHYETICTTYSLGKISDCQQRRPTCLKILWSWPAGRGPVITFLVALALLCASTSIYLKLVLSHVTNCLSLPFLSLYIYFFSTSLMMCGNNIIIKSFHEMKGDVGMAS